MIRKHTRRLSKTSGAILKGAKAKEPPKYDGTPDIDLVELWFYQVTQYFALIGMKSPWNISYLGHFLEGKAAQWFMDNVAGHPEAWNLEDLLRDLIDYCFPINFRKKLRKDYEDAYQGQRDLRDYVMDLKKKAKRLGDLNDSLIAQKLWRSVQPYLRVKWTEAGYDNETHTLDELLQSGINFENAEKLRIAGTRQNAIRQRYRSSRVRTRNSTPRRSETSTNWRSGAPKRGNTSKTLHTFAMRPPSSNPSHRRSGGRNPRRGTGFSQNRRPSAPFQQLSEAKKTELRAKHACFICEEPGHMARNCPKRSSARPSHIRTSAMRVATSIINAPQESLRLGMIRLDDEDAPSIQPEITSTEYALTPDEEREREIAYVQDRVNRELLSDLARILFREDMEQHPERTPEELHRQLDEIRKVKDEAMAEHFRSSLSRILFWVPESFEVEYAPEDRFRVTMQHDQLLVVDQELGIFMEWPREEVFDPDWNIYNAVNDELADWEANVIIRQWQGFPEEPERPGSITDSSMPELEPVSSTSESDIYSERLNALDTTWKQSFSSLKNFLEQPKQRMSHSLAIFLDAREGAQRIL